MGTASTIVPGLQAWGQPVQKFQACRHGDSQYNSFRLAGMGTASTNFLN